MKKLNILLLTLSFFFFIGVANAATITQNGEDWRTVEFNQSSNYNISSNLSLDVVSWNVDGVISNTTSNSLEQAFDTPGKHIIQVTGYRGGLATNNVSWVVSVHRKVAEATDKAEMFDETNYNNLMDNVSEFNGTGIVKNSVTPFEDIYGINFYLVLFVLPFVALWITQRRLTMPVVMALISGCLIIGFIPDQYRQFLGLVVALGFTACFYWMTRRDRY